MAGENWIRFEGYEGRLDPGYSGAYASSGVRYPLVERNRTWDIVRVEGDPAGGVYRRDQYRVLSRGHDMMKKAHEEAAAYRLHFKRCSGVGVCQDIGHPGGPKRAMAQVLTAVADTPTLETEAPYPPADVPPVAPAVTTAADPATDDRDNWISLLQPSGEPTTRTIAPGLDLRVIPLTFALWPGPPLGMRGDCSKRGGRVIGDQDDLSCAEVEIVKRLRRGGWEAGWFQAYKCGRLRWAPYIMEKADMPPIVQRVQRHAGSAGGHPDVIGWRGERVIAIESKSPTDRLKPSQIEWFGKALEAGMHPADIAVVEWRVLRAGAIAGPQS